MLAPMSRALLRAARAGCTYVKSVSQGTSGGAAGAGAGAGAGAAGEEEKDAAKSGEGARHVPVYERTFVASKWGAIPRNAEPPETEFLAKRRPGLPSLHHVSVPANGGLPEDAMGQPLQTHAAPMRKTKFRKTDPSTGAALIYEVWVPSGYKVEDEVKDGDRTKVEDSDSAVEIASPAPGTVVEGIGVADQNGVVIIDQDSSVLAPEPSKNPPASKRKAKGQGKGKRKKVMFAAGENITVEAEEAEVPSAQAMEEGEEQHLAGEEAVQEEPHGEETDQGEPRTEIKPEETEAIPAPAEPEQVAQETTSQSNIQELSTVPACPPPEPEIDPDIPMSMTEHDPPAPIQVEPPEPPSEEEEQPAETATAVPKAEETEDMDIDKQPVTQAQSEGEVAPIPEVPEQRAAEDSGTALEMTTIPSVPADTGEVTTAPTGTAPATETELPTEPNPPTTATAEEATTIDPITTEPEAPQPIVTTTTDTTAVGPPSTEPESHQVRFEDGEVDLLGSLEASLDRNPVQEEQQQQQQQQPPPETRIETTGGDGEPTEATSQTELPTEQPQSEQQAGPEEAPAKPHEEETETRPEAGTEAPTSHQETTES